MCVECGGSGATSGLVAGDDAVQVGNGNDGRMGIAMVMVILLWAHVWMPSIHICTTSSRQMTGGLRLSGSGTAVLFKAEQ
jgi:hypothetical protein